MSRDKTDALPLTNPPEDDQARAAKERRSIPSALLGSLKVIGMKVSPRGTKFPEAVYIRDDDWSLRPVQLKTAYFGEAGWEFITDLPEAARWGEPAPLLQPPEHYGLNGFKVINEHPDPGASSGLHLASGEYTTAWYHPARKGFPTIVYCHGNAGSLAARRLQLNLMAKRGFGVIIAAYPGFKNHLHRPVHWEPDQRNCINTAKAMVTHLVVHEGIHPSRMVLFGESLGGLVALLTAGELGQRHNFLEPILGPGPQELGAICTWAAPINVPERAGDMFPESPRPLFGMIENTFNAIHLLRHIKCKNICNMHGAADKLTKIKHLYLIGQAEQQAGKPAVSIEIPNVGHDPFFEAPTPRIGFRQVIQVVNSLRSFLEERGVCPPRQGHHMRHHGPHSANGNAHPWSERALHQRHNRDAHIDR